ALLVESGRDGDARAVLESALQHEPDHIPSLVKLTVLLIELNETQRARALIERAAELVPDDVDVQIVLAYAYRSAGHLTKALETLRRAEGDAPHNATIQTLAGQIELEMKHPRRAARRFERALQLDEHDDRLLPELASACTYGLRPVLFARAWKKVAAAHPDSVLVHYYGIFVALYTLRLGALIKHIIFLKKKSTYHLRSAARILLRILAFIGLLLYIWTRHFN
ncbi:tetratricopeptide repeat protein, partial [Candidatus Sumerlaeota bacterium]|nr:tetratricopeptide repeat protein [Candidatus Sumerlaeota bacterium]